MGTQKRWRARGLTSSVLMLMAAAGCAWLPSAPPPQGPPPVPGRSESRTIAPNRLSPETAAALEEAEKDPYWLQAKETLDRRVPELIAQHQDELKRGLRHAKLMRGDPQEKWVAITFDDGPHPDYTPKILDVLHRYDVKATFFLVGKMAERYPELVEAEMEAGHRIGNHTYHHVSLPKIPDEFVATELKACGEVLQSITGRTPRLFRPPGGEYDGRIAETAEALGYTMVLWTDDPGDYASPGEPVIERRVLGAISNGGIVLLHDGVQQTVDVLPQILEFLRTRGYRFVTVDEMLQQSRETGEPLDRSGVRH